MSSEFTFFLLIQANMWVNVLAVVTIPSHPFTSLSTCLLKSHFNNKWLLSSFILLHIQHSSNWLMPSICNLSLVYNLSFMASHPMKLCLGILWPFHTSLHQSIFKPGFCSFWYIVELLYWVFWSHPLPHMDVIWLLTLYMFFDSPTSYFWSFKGLSILILKVHAVNPLNP